jgi:predicted acetyltransferase
MLGVMPELVLLRPASALLDSYRAALEAGWSPHNLRGAAVAAEHLAAIAADPEGFLASLEQPPGRAGTVRLPDGSRVPRLPGFTRWLSDGEFCGAIHFRWQPGTEALPPHVLGHVGYTVVPWKRGRGLARRALALLLPEARARGLCHVELTTDPGNLASQRVILACGGQFVERFRAPAAYGAAEELRFRIPLPPEPAA